MMPSSTKERTRSILIDIARRHQRPGSGSSKAFLRERTCRMIFPDLTAILSPLRWAVIGAAATRLYMPERLTDDLDNLIATQDVADVKAKLLASGASPTGNLSIGRTSWRLADGFPLDVVEGSDLWIREALDQAR